MRRLSGFPLRYALTLLMAADRRVWTIPELIAGLAAQRIEPCGRPSKSVSDALRSEIRKGRVVRVGRGRYRFDKAHRSTLWRMRGVVRDAPCRLSWQCADGLVVASCCDSASELSQQDATDDVHASPPGPIPERRSGIPSVHERGHPVAIEAIGYQPTASPERFPR